MTAPGTRLSVLADAAAVARTAAAEVAATIRRAVARQGRCTVAVAGGRTPLAAYRLLAAMELPWPCTELFFGDERWVPADHPDSNYRRVAEALAGPAADRLRPMPTAGEPQAAADAYEALLRRTFPGAETFDLCLLGMGADGHCASLFPGEPALAIADRWVAPARAPTAPRQRLTLTFPALAGSAEVMFLVTGSDKRPALEAVHRVPPDHRLPAARVRSRTGLPIWLTDISLDRPGNRRDG